MDEAERIAAIHAGITSQLPNHPGLDSTVDHAPVRKQVLSHVEERLAIENALRYFPEKDHEILGPEFLEELRTYGRIYMYRFRPHHKIYARPMDEYPAQSKQAAAIMLMIQNNLDDAVAQHPHELITYGGNGGVFSNWAQYRLTMKYLSEMNDEQTLVMYSGHPMGLFPSHKNAPRVVVTNGMMIPNYSHAYLCGVRVKWIDHEKCHVGVRHKWINKNPFKSMFWAVQGMAAELATGALIIMKIKQLNQKISMLVIKN